MSSPTTGAQLSCRGAIGRPAAKKRPPQETAADVSQVRQVPRAAACLEL